MLPMTPMPSGTDEGEAVGGMSRKAKLLGPAPSKCDAFDVARAREGVG
jgi:hypothetical protein